MPSGKMASGQALGGSVLWRTWAGEQRGVDVEGAKGPVAVERESCRGSGGGASTGAGDGGVVQDEIVGVHADVGRDKDGIP